MSGGHTRLAGRHIALVEDDEIMGGSLLQRLELEGARVTWVKTVHRAIGAIRSPRQPVDVVLCDIRLPDGTGEALYLRLAEHDRPPPFLFMTAYATVDQAVRLLRAGAADFVTKPFEMSDLLERLVRLAAPSFPADGAQIFGSSPAARKLAADIARAAAADGPVLILGEAGTGKARAAARLHADSDRRSAPFVALDLSRLDAAQQETALFGPQGALADAGEGVLLLERIGDATQAMQVGLSDRMRGAEDPRLVATALSEDEAAAVRPDLRFALETHRLTIPPLRSRPEDALWLALRLFDALNARRAAPLRGLTAPAEAAVLGHLWPGNGRELRACLVRAVAMAKGEWLTPADLFPDRPDGGDEDDGFPSLASVREAAERAHIQRALAQAQGSPTEAARLLAVSRSTLWEKMQKLDLSSSDD